MYLEISGQTVYDLKAEHNRKKVEISKLILIFFLFFQEPQMAWTLEDKHIFEVATNVTVRNDMYRLGFHLGLEIKDIRVHLENNQGDLTMAVFDMLDNWSKDQGDLHVAFTKLVEALKGA